MVTIRPAGTVDCPAITEIYRHYVDHTFATFDYVAPDLDAWFAKYEHLKDLNRPFLVAIDDARTGEPGGGVVGFAYLGPFREKAAYDRTAEDTIYLAPDAGGRGIGSALLGALIEAANPDNVQQIIAVIAATGGEASIALHRKHGFAEVGRLSAVGHKFDEWIDCVYMQRAVR